MSGSCVVSWSLLAPSSSLTFTPFVAGRLVVRFATVLRRESIRLVTADYRRLLRKIGRDTAPRGLFVEVSRPQAMQSSKCHPAQMAYHDFTWLDKVSTAVGLPRPSCAEELTALLDMAVEQELSCVVKSLPLRRAPGIDNSVDIGAALLSTFGTELTFGTPPGGELLGHRGRHTDIGSRSGEIRWSDMRELLIDDASDDFTLADQLSCHQSSEL